MYKFAHVCVAVRDLLTICTLQLPFFYLVCPLLEKNRKSKIQSRDNKIFGRGAALLKWKRVVKVYGISTSNLWEKKKVTSLI